MQVSKLIENLEALKQSVGDVDVTITDGYDARCYCGEYSVEEFFDPQTCQMTIDIGIGGTEQ